MNTFSRVTVALFVLVLVSCGGTDHSNPVPVSSSTSTTGDTDTDSSTTSSDSSSSSSTSSNSAPLANAGGDFSGLAGATVNLVGTAADSDGTIKTVEWEQLSGTSATIASDGELETTVELPEVTISETLTFQLTVTDDDGATDEDRVSITVELASDSAQVSSTLAVDAGDDQVVMAGETVTLSGHAYRSTSTGYTYEWSQESGSTVELSSSTGREVTFVAPLTDETANSETLIFVLAVTDDEDTVTDTTTVTIFNELSQPTGLVATSTDEAITLTWTAVNGAESYDIYYANESFESLAEGDLDVEDLDNYGVLDGGALKAYQANVTQFVLTDFTVSTAYYFIVVARRGVYVSDPSVQTTTVSSSTNTTTGSSSSGSDTGTGTGSTTTGTATNKLNDSGQLDCYSNVFSPELGSCSADGNYPKQDGRYGRDWEFSQGNITKTGAGVAGFDFTKISSTGEASDADVAEPACVLDNVTGLLWEGKGNTTDSTLLDEVRSDYQYAWYYSDSQVSASIPGNRNIRGGSYSCSDLVEYCNISDHVDALNEAKWCGRSNWRVPWLTELATLIYYGQGDRNSLVDPMIDTDYFPNVEGSYWTLSIEVMQSHEGTTGTNAWIVDFDSGVFETLSKNNPAKIMAVSGD